MSEKLRLGVLNQHLTCVLCGGYLIDATALSECLHSFCRSCIVKYLEENRLCPICDGHIPEGKENEHLRSDQILQSLVYKLVPGLYQREMAARRKLYEERGAEGAPPGEASGHPPVNKYFCEEDQISLTLQYYKCSTTPKITYLKCAAANPLRNLTKLLRSKFQLDSKIDILYDDEILDQSLTIMDVAYAFQWDQSAPLALSFRIHEKSALKPAPEPAVDPHQRQRQSEYLGHLNLNPRVHITQPKTNGTYKEAKKDDESDSNQSLKIVSEKDTPGQSSDEEYSPRNLKKAGKRKKHDSLRKTHLQKRRKSEGFAEVMRQKEEDKKRRKSLFEAMHRRSDEGEDTQNKNEALKKVFVYKEKPDAGKRKDDLKRKKRKKSKHHEGQPKKRKTGDYPAPSILSVDNDALKLKVKLPTSKPKLNGSSSHEEERKREEERKAEKDASLTANLRAVRKPVVAKKEFISGSPSLTISKVGAKDQTSKTSLIESKPSLEIMLVNKNNECNGAPKKPAEPAALDLSEKVKVLDLSDKSSRLKTLEKSPVEKSPNKSTQQSILQIAETLVNRKLSPTPEMKPADESMAVVAMRDLQTLSDAAVNILMAAQSHTPKREESNGLKIPVYPRERTTPPVPNLREIFPSRMRPLAPPLPAKQNQSVRQIPNPSAILNRQNFYRQPRPDFTSPGKEKPPVPPLLKKIPTPIRRPEMVKNIESVAAGLTARATAMIDTQ